MARILFFGKLADLAGMAETQHSGNVVVSQIVVWLAKDNAELGAALCDLTTRAAVNLHLIPRGEDPIITPQDELAFMPPVSGG